MVGIVHAVFLDIEHCGIDVATASVEVGGMNVNHQWLACDLLGVNTGRIGEPVVRVDNIAWNGACNHTSHNRIIVDFLNEVIGVTTGELDAAQVVGVHIIEITVDVISQIKISLRVHHIADTALHIFAAHVAPCDRRGVGANDSCKSLLFVAPRLGYNECDVHVAAIVHTFRKTVACGSETTENMRGKFPTKH